MASTLHALCRSGAFIKNKPQRWKDVAMLNEMLYFNGCPSYRTSPCSDIIQFYVRHGKDQLRNCVHFEATKLLFWLTYVVSSGSTYKYFDGPLVCMDMHNERKCFKWIIKDCFTAMHWFPRVAKLSIICQPSKVCDNASIVFLWIPVTILTNS